METEKQGGTTGQHEINVIDKMIEVVRGAWNAYTVSVDLTEMPGCHITGSFSASGGYGDDIEFLVFDEKNYKEWEYRMTGNYRGEPKDVPALYRSGRVVTGTFGIPVTRSDTYYLVFNNAFSSFSDKAVMARVYLSYGK